MTHKLLLCLFILISCTANSRADKCDKAVKKLAKYLKDNGKSIDRCAEANAVGVDYPECKSLAENVVKLDTARLAACK